MLLRATEVSVGLCCPHCLVMQQEPRREQGDGVDSAASGTGLSLIAEYLFVLVLFLLDLTSIV